MLTQSQKKYMEKIPEHAKAHIKPWDEKAAEFARNIVMQLEKDTGLEVFWSGSLALGIPGENDVDLTIFAEPKDFDLYLPHIISILGEPTYKLDEKILWRIIKDGHKIDATLASKDLEGVQDDIFFFESIKNNKKLFQEYTSLKEEGLSAREYYKRKNEFYNRIMALKK